jgi:aminopeptidase-like protein
MASLTRYPYPEYHCSRDNLSIISERALNESLNVLLKGVDYLESSHLVRKKFQGTPCLSHPKYDLYVDPGQPAFGTDASPETKKMRLLMDLIPTLKRSVTVKSLSERVGLGESAVTHYLEKWAKKGLLEIQ